MDFTSVPTERTSAATDLLLAAASAAAMVRLAREKLATPGRGATWTAVFGLLGAASILGGIVHGVVVPPRIHEALWIGIYLFLGLAVAFFLVAAVLDRWGPRTSQRVLPFMLGLAVAFFLVTRVVEGTFLVFIGYEAAAMLFALAVYGWLAARGALPGSLWITAGIALSLIAAAVQATKAVSFTLVWPFDSNAVFHLVQTVAIGLLLKGLTAREGVRVPEARPR